ncbi:MAG: hypothetical protein IPL96_17395 [Holophagaceae bacterium]|nr:hypothetical protein [Holophagaceae bacterium]
MRTSHSGILVCALAGLLLACGSGASAGLSTEPAAPVVMVGERLEVTLVSEEPLKGEPEWEVQELYGGGLLASRGRTVTYLAPPAAGTFHLVARGLRADGTAARLVQPVTVTPQARLEPQAANLRPGATQLFVPRIKGLPRGTVAWKVEDADGGAITPEGLYTAPGRAGTYRILATSTEDASVVLVATVTVN